MEIIPILAFIVLVATIGTFIFSIGAYILFKIRESKGRVEKEAKQEAVEAELVSAEPTILYQENPHPPSQRQRRPAPQYYPENKNQTAEDYPADEMDVPESGSRFMRYTQQGYVPVSKNNNGKKAQWR